MFEALKKIFGLGPGVNYKELVAQGALIVDVRTKGEYQSGHINKSLNIPVDAIQGQLKQFKKKDQVIITCCASGMRSGRAASILKSSGYTNVYNGGGWASLKSKL
ncbi:MAG: sulfurtransferase [Cytophagales bacterium CG12_big_fil_rev_8_21_14_0_65_40_12]|nr:MAG: sulfurtransferase [Cytophagales bacterium CG12_big_fil_rev_8_21_14_0_65_40_12]PIW02925.1 MAG: sulfurtransferase [Cytophagales bacterium CG17_big_fil_post_rev_8_21_14_2_50_40_13]